jgi:lipopolysaccharide transport system ATP-binding protein
MTPTIIFDRVGKKFSRGYASDSLRDAITQPFRRLFGWNGKSGQTPQSGAAQRRKEFWALREASFEVKSGEALGIIGANGSGKSTTLKLLSRILRPDVGSVAVRGRVGALIELGAGFHPDLTGRENVFLNAAVLGMSKKEITRRYDEIVDFAELQDFMDTPVKWFSSGMFARLGFSVAAHMNPQIMIVDEVLSVGDFGFQKRCLDKMMHFKALGVTIIFVSHNMQAVASLCDRAILLEQGKIVKMGKTEETIAEYFNKFRTSSHDNPDKAILLEKGRITDIDGVEINSFKSGQKAIVSIGINFRIALSNIIVTFSVRTKNGMHAFGTDSMRLTGSPIDVAANQKVEISVELTLNLVPGEYEIGTSIYNRSIQKTVFSEFFSSFVIQSNFICGGIAYLDPKLINQQIIYPKS